MSSSPASHIDEDEISREDASTSDSDPESEDLNEDGILPINQIRDIRPYRYEPEAELDADAANEV